MNRTKPIKQLFHFAKESMRSRIASLLALSIVVCVASVAMAQSKDSSQSNSKLSSEQVLAENTRLAKEVVERWQDWVATNPELLQSGEMAFRGTPWDSGSSWLESQLKTVEMIFEPELAIAAVKGTQNNSAVHSLVRQQLALGNIEVAEELIGSHPENFFQLNLLGDTANYAADKGRTDLLDWVDGRLASVPSPDSDAGNAALLGMALNKEAIQFVSTAARLQLLRSEGASSNAIRIEEAAIRLTELAKKLPETGKVRSSAIRLAELESWSEAPNRQADRAVEKAVATHASLKPLAAIAKQFHLANHDSEIINTSESIDILSSWLARQVANGRQELAIAMVVQQEHSLLTRVRLLSRISESLAVSNKDLALECSQAAQSLMHEALQSELGEKHWEVLDSVSNLAIAFQALGDTKSANELLRKAIRFWSEHCTEKPPSLQGGRAYSVLAMMEAISVTDVEASELDPRLHKLMEGALKWGYAQTHWQFDPIRKNYRQYPILGVERTIDTTKLLASTRERADAAQNPEFFRWFDKKSWPQAVNAFRSAPHYGVSKESRTVVDWGTKTRMFGQVIRGSLQQHGLQGTLAWTKEIEEPTVRMALELDAILQTFQSRITIPSRDTNTSRSIVPFSLIWSGC